MSTKTKNQKYLGILVIAVIAIAGLGYTLYTQPTIIKLPWNWDFPSAPTPTPIYTNPTPIPITPNPTATMNPTPTEIPTTTPVIIQPRATIWQALYVTNLGGSSYWVSPPSPYTASNVLGYNGQVTALVSTVQNNIYMNIVDLPYQVNSWSFTCIETIIIENSNHIEKGVVASSSVYGSGTFVNNGQNTYVLGAAMPVTNLQSMVQNIMNGNLQAGYYAYFAVDLKGIVITLHFANGQTGTLTSPGGYSNTLEWKLLIQGA